MRLENLSPRVLGVASFVLFGASLATAASLYTITSLDPLIATDINNSGQIVGTRWVGQKVLPSIWTPNGSGGYTIRDVDPLGSRNYGSYLEMNNAGQFVGDIGAGIPRPTYLWKDDGTPNGTAINLGDPDPAGSAIIYPSAINDSGIVVGNTSSNQSHDNAFIWRPNVPNGMAGTFTLLSGVPNGNFYTHISVHDINAPGDVVGYDDTPSRTGAFMWRSSTGTRYQLPSVVGGPGAINDVGQIISGIIDVNNQYRAFLWTPTTPNGTTGTSVDLGYLPPRPGYPPTTGAYDINNSGIVVGESAFDWFPDRSFDGHAFIWTAADGMIDLNTLLLPTTGAAEWELTVAYHINDVGQILGNGYYDPDGPGPQPYIRAYFVMTPVPEAASLSLLASTGLTLLRRRP